MVMLHAVIGANYGDEGKGLVTDYLSTDRTLVVRFNGGAQAGHTVVTPEGRRHVFHHFGAGCFRGAGTLLSRHFIVNPLLWAREFDGETLRGVRKVLYVDPRCRVTTPLDMMLNALVEQKRGDQRHGSCGVGINETVTRCEHEAYRLTVRDLTRLPLKDIVDRCYAYAGFRAQRHGVTLPSLTEVDAVFMRWDEDARRFVRANVLVDDVDLLAEHPDVVFEGAQGLRLDEHAPGFPHVTRSRTGLTNVVELLQEAGRTEPLDVTYVTRTYVTRHGAGPLHGERDGHPYGWTGPETNVENEHQGKLRYAYLHTPDLLAAIRSDVVSAIAAGQGRPRGWLRPGIAVTCLDQFGEPQHADLYADWVAFKVGWPLRYRSYGPTRADVVEGPVGTPSRPVGATSAAGPISTTPDPADAS